MGNTTGKRRQPLAEITNNPTTQPDDIVYDESDIEDEPGRTTTMHRKALIFTTVLT